jgi:hypothetical protein
MSALLKLLDLAPGGDAQTWIGPASGPSGKRSYGGQFVAQSLAAAWHTVDTDRPPTNMHLQFLRGGEAGETVEYRVARVFDGRTAAARRVDSYQDGRLLTTATVSFAADLPGPQHGHRADMPGDPAVLPRTGPAGPAPSMPLDELDIRIDDDTSTVVAGNNPAARRREGPHVGRGLRHRCVHDRPRAAGAWAFDEGPHASQRHHRFVDLVPPADPGR